MDAPVAPPPASSRAEFIAASAVLWPVADDDARAFLARYTRSLDDEDLHDLTPAALALLAHEHWQDARRRRRGTDVVAVHDVPHPEARRAPHSHLDIVTDDRPFLVSSVLGALTRLDLGVHLILHPTFVVERAENGDLLRVLGAAPSVESVDVANTEAIAIASDLTDPLVESWIHVEIDWVGSDRQDEVVGVLQRVLQDVTNATTDWTAMRAKAVDIAFGLIDETPEDLRADAARAAQALNWLVDDNFTFLGYEEHDLVTDDGVDALRARPETALGIVRRRLRPAGDRILTNASLAKARERAVLIVTKANSRSTVHRNAYLDYIGVKRFDADGHVVGERRFLGLFSSRLYHQSVEDIPLARDKVHKVLAALGLRPQSHSGRELVTALESYPRDELFQSDTETLATTINAIQHLAERRRTSVFIRRDVYDRFVTVMVYLPRDVYNTTMRLAVSDILREVYQAVSVDHESQVGESSLARIYFSVRGAPGAPIAHVDEAALTSRIIEATRSWDDEFSATALAWSVDVDSTAETVITPAWGDAFSDGYKDTHTPEQAMRDALRVARVLGAAGRAPADTSAVATARADGLEIEFFRPEGEPARAAGWRAGVVRDRPLRLGEVLPIFANLGVDVIGERPAQIDAPMGHCYLYEFDVELTHLGEGCEPAAVAAMAAESFCASWLGWNEPDTLDRLVLAVGMPWRDVVVLRAAVRYLRQVGLNYSNLFMSNTLEQHLAVTRAVIELFHARFDPDSASAAVAEGARRRIGTELDAITNLETDRVLRRIAELVDAIVRTNFFQRDQYGAAKPYLAFKLDPSMMSALPQPVPQHEVWVYSPRVEGVHLRFGAVARGGLRWSDRREDFRTEVLGLVKAQVVKNAVIVPTGAKGGFYPKRLPPAADRERWLAEGRGAYVTFIRGLLDVTDNQVLGDGVRRIEPPDRTVRYDNDDSYLVVAADKGTATFSDLANSIALEYGYWLGDAFASGGSHGYDHKAMGITARGAWCAVERHFFELGIDPARDRFTAVGVGDMSGDVFGNGMLRSRTMQLVAVFDHRHIFLDPDPLPGAFDERQRLFELPRSTWQDFSPALISAGGGVFGRELKAIALSARMRERLGLPPTDEPLTPAAIIRAILTAPVDLLFNGGIGTMVKASTETDAQVGDKSNDPIRVDGAMMRARVVAEGGNLGLTQAGRIEAAVAGVRLNTDSIDNSAGVDTSDHEVNIKILISQQEPGMAADDRDELLQRMTETVAELVLADNVDQNRALGVERLHGRPLSVYRRLLDGWEQAGILDRALEGLPDDTELVARAANGIGLYSPELAVIISYAKIEIAHAIEQSALPDEPGQAAWLTRYFPAQLVTRYGDALAQHPLASSIVATRLADDIVNHGGISFVFAAAEESQVSIPVVVRAYTAARFLFDLDGYFEALAGAGAHVDAQVQAEAIVRLRRTLGRAVRWLISTYPDGPDPATLIDRYAAALTELRPVLPEVVGVGANPQRESERDRLIAAGVDPRVAERFTLVLDEVPLFEVIDIAERILAARPRTGPSPLDAAVCRRVVAHVFFGLSERFEVDSLLFRVSDLPSDDKWQAASRTALRDDLYHVLARLTSAVIERADMTVLADLGADEAASVARRLLDDWEKSLGVVVTRVHATLAEVASSSDRSSAPILVALRVVRTLLAPASSAR